MEKPGGLAAALARSPSTRRAWIEIRNMGGTIAARYNVALHPEGVDRNIQAPLKHKIPPGVALHPEGVDRNTLSLR